MIILILVIWPSPAAFFFFLFTRVTYYIPSTYIFFYHKPKIIFYFLHVVKTSELSSPPLLSYLHIPDLSPYLPCAPNWIGHATLAWLPNPHIGVNQKPLAYVPTPLTAVALQHCKNKLSIPTKTCWQQKKRGTENTTRHLNTKYNQTHTNKQTKKDKKRKRKKRKLYYGHFSFSNFNFIREACEVVLLEKKLHLLPRSVSPVPPAIPPTPFFCFAICSLNAYERPLVRVEQSSSPVVQALLYQIVDERHAFLGGHVWLKARSQLHPFIHAG